MCKSPSRLRIAIILLVLVAQHSISNAAAESCSRGQYYVRALGGYVLIPSRYLPYAFELEPGMTGSYRSPSPPLSRRCIHEKTTIGAGNIQTGSLEAFTQKPGKIPASKPTSKSRFGEFEITVWSLPPPGDGSQWLTVLITKNEHAMRIFEADPEEWRRILDSYSE